MNIIMKYDFVLDMYNKLGDEKFFDCFSKKFSDFNLYTMSIGWIASNEYILKFRGTYGDLIVSWN